MPLALQYQFWISTPANGNNNITGASIAASTCVSMAREVLSPVLSKMVRECDRLDLVRVWFQDEDQVFGSCSKCGEWGPAGMNGTAARSVRRT